MQTEIDLKVSGLQIHPNSAFPTYRKNLFEIEVSESLKHLFSANTEAEKDEWLFLLNKTSNKGQNETATNSTTSTETSTQHQNMESTSPTSSSSNGWESKRKSIRFTKTSVNLGLTRSLSAIGNDNFKKQFNATNSFSSPPSRSNSEDLVSPSISNNSSSSSSFQLGHLNLPIPPPVPVIYTLYIYLIYLLLCRMNLSSF